MVLQLIEKEHLTDNVWAFRFKPSESLSWTPGQFMQVELLHERPDKEGTKRYFTVSSPPYESVVQITTRITGTSFKNALSKLPIGGELHVLERPSGDFVWQDSDLPKVFIAQGIGITPFYSILKQRIHDHLTLDLTLIYSSRTEDVPFKDEINDWATHNPQFKVQYLTGQWLNAESLARLVPHLNQSLVYVSGPEPMVISLGDDLIKHGLPQSQLKQDELVNYNERNY